MEEVERKNWRALENQKIVGHFGILFNFVAKSESTKL